MMDSRKRAGWSSLNSQQTYKVKKVLDEYRKNHPNCELTGSNKKVQVHHIMPIWARPDLADDPNNLISLSTEANIHLIYGHNGNFGRKYVENILEIKEQFKKINNNLTVVIRPQERQFYKSNFIFEFFNKYIQKYKNKKQTEISKHLLNCFLGELYDSKNKTIFKFINFKDLFMINSTYLELTGRISKTTTYIDLDNGEVSETPHINFIEDTFWIIEKCLETLNKIEKNKLNFLEKMEAENISRNTPTDLVKIEEIKKNYFINIAKTYLLKQKCLDLHLNYLKSKKICKKEINNCII